MYQGQIVMPVETNWPILDQNWTTSGTRMLIEKQSKDENSIIKSKHAKRPCMHSL